MRQRGIIGAAVFAVGCASEPLGVRPFPPVIDAAAVVPNPDNALSAVVSVRVRHADSVAVFYGLQGSALDSATPAVTPVGDQALIPVLGLLPDSAYAMLIVAYGGAHARGTGPLSFVTGSLPADLPRYTASGSDPSPGYVVFAAGMYGLVIDNTGRVVWYHRFPTSPGLNFQAQPNGRYVARPATPTPAWVELDPLGRVTRTFGCAGGLVPRFHDLNAEPDGAYWIMCDETRLMDLSALGGVVNAQVTGTVVQHVSAAGNLLFQWSPFDHFEITDLDPADRTGTSVNWTHGNALDLDADGNLLVSLRSLGEITKIDARTGAVIWRMGGLRNQFTFLDTPMPAFSRQHSARVVGPGSLLLLDNVGDPVESRAEHYTVEEATRTARLAHSYGSIPGVLTLIGGGVQALAGERTLVSFGTAGRVEEYDAAGRVVWRIEGHAGYVFRAQRIKSLYTPGAGTAR